MYINFESIKQEVKLIETFSKYKRVLHNWVFFRKAKKNAVFASFLLVVTNEAIYLFSVG